MKSTTKIAAGAGLVATGALLLALRSKVRHPVGNASVPEPRRAVNIERYAGRWYELARYEQGFERGFSNVTAHYWPRDDGKVEVVNSGRRPDGSIKVIRGVARSVSASNAKLKVRFFNLFNGDYWVLDHGDDYSWSIVGEPSGRYLWILGREPNPSADLVNSLIERASSMGYDTDMLLRTVQDFRSDERGLEPPLYARAVR